MLPPDNDQVVARKAKREQLAKIQKQAYPNRIAFPTPAASLHAVHETKSEEDLLSSPDPVVVAGRIHLVRDFGKGIFFQCRDHTRNIQLFLSQKDVDEHTFALGKLVDLGDLVHAQGVLFRTKTGELTLRIQRLQVLAKCLYPLPEKYHGLADIEMRHRKRYLDLIMNPDAFSVFVKRSAMVSYLRRFLEKRDYLEVETPMMQHIPSGALAKPFVTHHNALDLTLYLRVAPELFLKRLMVGGYPRIYELNRNFRNEGISAQHNPEFTSLEYYEAYATYEDYMRLTETLMMEVCQHVHQATDIIYQGTRLSFAAPFPRIPMFEALSDRLKVSIDDLFDSACVTRLAKAHGVEIQPFHTPAEVAALLFESLFEAELLQPTFVVGFPRDVSPLARANEKDSRFVDRFELYVAGFEVANGFSELNDPTDQLQRFEAQHVKRTQGYEEALPIDWDFVEALSYGMPPAAGCGIGIDRLAMVMLNQPSIRDVILFPTLRP